MSTTYEIGRNSETVRFTTMKINSEEKKLNLEKNER